jgi:redox-sensitive bicupin YhaK (pirin superfamily)
MLQQTPGKIFLADERGLAESDRFRRYSTFSFGPWAHPHKGPFGRLYGVNEETLAGGHALDFTVVEASHVVIVPITGAVALAGFGQSETTVGVEEASVLTLPAGSTLRVRNPYGTELVSFLHLWLLADAPEYNNNEQRSSFNSETIQNQLVRLLPAAGNSLPVTVSLGRFAGRQEAVYQLENLSNSVFVFALAGAFEVESRLLHEKDGLALWDISEIELEALSNDALVLVLELAPRAA